MKPKKYKQKRIKYGDKRKKRKNKRMNRKVPNPYGTLQ